MITQVVLTRDYNSVCIRCGGKYYLVKYVKGGMIEVHEEKGESKFLLKIPGVGVTECRSVVDAWSKGVEYLINLTTLSENGVTEYSLRIARTVSIYKRELDELFLEGYVPVNDRAGIGKYALDILLHKYLDLEGLPPYIVSLDIVFPLLSLIKIVSNEYGGKVYRKSKLYHVTLGSVAIIIEPAYSSKLLITMISRLEGRNIFSTLVKYLVLNSQYIERIRFGKTHRPLDSLLDLYTYYLRNRTYNHHHGVAHSWPLSASSLYSRK